MMSRSLNLLKRDFLHQEKRVFPRFPYSFLTFKVNGKEGDGQARTFEVADISRSGMKISLKNGDLFYREGDLIEGTIRSVGKEIHLGGIIRWSNGVDLGIEFQRKEVAEKELESFFSLERVVQGIKAIHSLDVGPTPPPNLKYWLKSDGALSLYVWEHALGGHFKFQIMIFENFIEWEDGKGISTGKKVEGKKVESPLSSSDEFTLEMDDRADQKKLDQANLLLSLISSRHLPSDVNEFISIKLKSL